MTINQQLDDAYADNAVDMQQLTTGIVIAMMRILNRYDAPMMAALLVAIDQIPPEQFTMQRLDLVLGEVQRINSEAYNEVMRELEAQLASVVEHESDWQYALLLGLLPPVLRINQTQSPSVFAIAQTTPFQGNILRDWLTSLAAGRLTKIKNAVRTGFMNGESASEIVNGIRGTRAKKFSDGILQQSRVDLDTIIRTAVAHFVETAKEQFNKANAHLIKLVRWLSILDSRTSHWCIARADKLYTPVQHSPVGHNVPWLSGPGRLHFRAITKGSLITTDKGDIPVELIRKGDMVLTHAGRFKPVLNAMSKPNEVGVVRVIHMESGRVLGATDDHPVFSAGKGWVFCGAVEVGDNLFGNVEKMSKVSGIPGVIISKTKNSPSIIDEPGIALNRTLELVASGIDLNTDLDINDCEIDKAAVYGILRNPSIIECQSNLHHLLAFSQILAIKGANRLRHLLAALLQEGLTAHKLCHPLMKAIGSLCSHGGIHDSRHAGRVVAGHAARMSCVNFAGFFGHAESPVIRTDFDSSAPCFQINDSLFGFAPNGNIMSLSKARDGSITEAVLALDSPHGEAILSMLNLYEECVIGNSFAHDTVRSLSLSKYEDTVYDLEVQDDASYVCNGIVVSNCRSGAAIVIKSWRELKLTGLSEEDRAALDGQVPPEQNYSSWLAKQSPARQDEILGKERATLYRNGNLSIGQMFKENGRWLTLEQLRSRK